MASQRNPGLEPDIHVLVVDHDQSRLERTCRRLLAEGCAVSTATVAVDLLQRVQRLGPDLVLIDVLMPGLDDEERAALLAACTPTSLSSVVIHTRILPALLRTVVNLRDVLGVIRSTDDDAEFSTRFHAVVQRMPPRSLDSLRPAATSGTHRIRVNGMPASVVPASIDARKKSG
jgi:CheY-like chemotaxis protein